MMVQRDTVHKHATSADEPEREPRRVHANASLRDRFHRLGPRLLGRIWAWTLRLQLATWRTEVEGLERFEQLFARGERLLLTFWHGKYIPLFVLFRGHNACVFASESVRGDVITEICRQFGYDCVKIPDHGRGRSLDLMRAALANYAAGAVAVDGPLGPYHVVHRGAIQLASELGFALLPASVAARRKRVRPRRWDRLEIPRLFTRVCLVIGAPMTVPANLPPERIADWTSRLHEALEALDRRAEEKAHD